MNKQEYQQKIKNMKRPKFFNAITLDEAYEAGFEEAKNNALFESCFLDEPEKPVVPQFVADWYEENKGDIENSIFDYSYNWSSKDTSSFNKWFSENDNKPIQTLVNMHQYGYEVEKEKLYTVEIPNPNGGTYLALCKDVDGKLFFDAFFSEEWKTFGKCKLTESEIKEDFAWAWQFAEEVEE